MKMKISQGVIFLISILAVINLSQAKELSNPYMGAPVKLGKAENRAIANQKLLDGVGKFNWLKPTIENPAKGIWVFGGYGLAPISIIEAKDGLIAFDTGDSKHDGEAMLKAIRTSKIPLKYLPQIIIIVLKINKKGSYL